MAVALRTSASLASAGRSQRCPASVVAMKASPSIQVASIMSAKPSVHTPIFRTAVPVPGSRARRSVSVQASDKSEGTPAAATATAPAPAEAAPVKSCCEGSAAAAPADVESHKVNVADEYEEYEEEVVQEVAAPPMLERLQGVDYKGIGLKAGAVFLGITFVVSAIKTVRKTLTPKAKRKRTVNKNKVLVDKLAEFLPAKRAELNPRVCKSVMSSTGFTGTEVFRKYLWFLLRERKFEQDAMDDLVQLKGSLGLTDSQVSEAVKERSERIYEKYGTLLMNTEGLTAEGATRKATGRALFSKLLYISENEQLIAQESAAAQGLSVPEVFGATDRDTDALRIVSLYDVDLEKLNTMAMESDSGSSDEVPGEGTEKPPSKSE